MELHELSFCKIIILREDIAEVIMNDGVEMDLDMVNQYHDFLLTHLTSPFSVLINRINSYTYNFDAQIKIGTLKELNAIAVVSYSRVTDIVSKGMASLPRNKEWNFKMFSTREEALTWAISEQDKLTG